MPLLISDIQATRPTTLVSADSRFGFAPLSYKYRDYAVNGELMQDKATGELFIKRPKDGRAMSYFQNKRYLYEQATELNHVAVTNQDYVFDKVKKSGLYTFIDYDMLTIGSEARKNIFGNYDDTDSEILDTKLTFEKSEDAVDRYGVRFKLTGTTNKFICRFTTRDADKPVIEYMTALYDSVFLEYTSSGSELDAEYESKSKYKTWGVNNCLLTFSVTAYGKTGIIWTPTENQNGTNIIMTEPVRLNDTSCVDFKKDIIDNWFRGKNDTCDYIVITLRSLTFSKINFVRWWLKSRAVNPVFGLPSVIKDKLNKMTYYDDTYDELPLSEAFVYNCGIGGFQDSIAQVNTNPQNGTIVCICGVGTIMRYINMIRSSTKNYSLILSGTEPASEEWNIGSMWGEILGTIGKDGDYTISTNENTHTMATLNKYYSHNIISSANFIYQQNRPSEGYNLWFEPISN